jgi:hypothetical protein
MMLKLIALLSGTALLMACGSHLIATSSPSLPSTPNPPNPPNPMLTATGITLQPVTLQAREEQQSSSGQPPKADRDIGFADVFWQLENQRETEQTVVIEQIQIQDAATGRVYMTTTAPQTIRLRPLESVAQDFHLTNKTGFSGQGAIQAIVRVKIAGQSTVLTSSAIRVDRF